MSLKILIVYAGKTNTGSTATLAKYIKTGTDSVNNVTSLIKTASTATLTDVLGSDAIILGSGDYNGNPEPDMIDFLDNTLGAGMKSSMDKIKTMPFGIFATSAGYSTGVQEVLNSMARALMTFGAIYVGGGSWHNSQGIAGMTEKSSSGGWDWANSTTTQKYLKQDACEYGRRLAVASLSVPNMFNKLKENPSICSNSPKPKPQSPPPSPQNIANTLITIGFVIILVILSILWKKQGFGNLGWILSGTLIILSLLTIVLMKRKNPIKIRQYVAGVVSFAIIFMMISGAIYGYTHNILHPQLIVLSTFGLLLANSIIMILSIPGLSPGLPPGPPPPSLKCSSSADCPNTTLFSCTKNICVLKDPKLKTNITKYLDSIYPSTPKLSSMLTDVELYNFFITLGYYWLSFNSPDAKDILKTLDSKFPTTIQCGGFYVLPASDDTTACGSKPHSGDSNWPCMGTPTCANPCCKPGSLSIPPVLNQLYWCDYITKSTEVLRNGYDPRDTFNKSVLYDPVYLYNTQKLSNKTALQNLCLIRDGRDGTGKKLTYKVCDGGATYDFTSIGPGFESNSLVGCVRNKGVSGHATDTFYYMAQGTGNQLQVGVTARTLNKVHGTLLLIRRAGELNFGSLTTYKFSPTFTTTKTLVKLSDGKFTNSFVQAPQLLLLECLSRESGSIAFQNPTTQTGFGNDAASKAAPGATWPFTTIPPQSTPQQPFTELLKWYFAYKKVKLPDISDYKNNWSNWDKKAVNTLGMFFDAVSVPEFDSWELNYMMNRMSNSSAYDIIIYALIGAKNVEITGTGDSETPGPKDNKGKPFLGVTNSKGKYIETFGCSIQPGGAAGWAYEMIDYRLNLSNAKGSAAIWTKYANKFIKVGNPLTTDSLKSCTPRFCTSTDQAACEPGDASPEQADWLVLTCQGPLAPAQRKYKCANGTCSLDPTGTYTDQNKCKSSCTPSPPPPPPTTEKCKDISEGAKHNYCSGWCNNPNVWSNCGSNSDGSMTCNCAGCSGCPP